MSATERWEVRHRHGTAAEMHALDLPADPVPAMWILDATSPAVVLGSAEPEAHVDRTRLASLGLDLVRRRSGGGAVLVDPAACTWVDLVIPAGHARWDRDVGRAMHWVGDLWRAALADLGVASEVHRGPLRRSPWSAQVCFAGLGPGEVVDAQGRKLVGVSQRRTRTAARFQTVAYHADPSTDVVDLLALDEEERAAARSAIAAATATIPVAPADLVAALVARLP